MLHAAHALASYQMGWASCCPPALLSTNTEPWPHAVFKMCLLWPCLACLLLRQECMQTQVHCFFQTTDNGSDEVYGGKLLACECEAWLQILHTRTPCYQHQGHWGVRDGFVHIDSFLKDHKCKWTYFSTLDTRWRNVPSTLNHPGILKRTDPLSIVPQGRGRPLPIHERLHEN